MSRVKCQQPISIQALVSLSHFVEKKIHEAKHAPLLSPPAGILLQLHFSRSDATRNCFVESFGKMPGSIKAHVDDARHNAESTKSAAREREDRAARLYSRQLYRGATGEE